ncbi:MAG: hypothetical protein PHD01_11155 [Geobacteraceae bacterium]|nr:hypothetical protein [Geobacteraceae bacterium]
MTSNFSAGNRLKVRHMDRDKQKQEISLIGRLLSLEALLVIMGLLSLASGIITKDLLRLSFGVIILGSAALAVVLRRKRKPQAISEKQHRRKDD